MKTLPLLAAVAAIPFLSPAAAAPAAPASAANWPSLMVPFADLDLSSEQGSRTFHRRIAAAAATLCGPMSDADMAGKRIVLRCRRAVTADASAENVRALSASSSGAQAGHVRVTLREPQDAPRRRAGR